MRRKDNHSKIKRWVEKLRDVLSLWPLLIFLIPFAIMIYEIFRDFEKTKYNIGETVIGAALLYGIFQLVVTISILKLKRKFKRSVRNYIDSIEEKLPVEYCSCKYALTDNFLYEDAKKLGTSFEWDSVCKYVVKESHRLLMTERFCHNGELDSESEAPALCFVFDNASRDALSMGYLTQKEFEELTFDLEQKYVY